MIASFEYSWQKREDSLFFNIFLSCHNILNLVDKEPSNHEFYVVLIVNTGSTGEVRLYYIAKCILMYWVQNDTVSVLQLSLIRFFENLKSSFSLLFQYTIWQNLMQDMPVT